DFVHHESGDWYISLRRRARQIRDEGDPCLCPYLGTGQNREPAWLAPGPQPGCVSGRAFDRITSHSCFPARVDRETGSTNRRQGGPSTHATATPRLGSHRPLWPGLFGGFAEGRRTEADLSVQVPRRRNPPRR